jgi:hypothetical protein
MGGYIDGYLDGELTMGAFRYLSRTASPRPSPRERLAAPKSLRASSPTLPLYLQAQPPGDLEQQAQAGEQAFANAGPAAVEQAGVDLPAPVHLRSDAAAHHTASAAGARALTAGSDIVFNRGEYNPSSAAGRALIGHELVHAGQQQAGLAQGVQRKSLADAGEAQRKKLELPSTGASIPDETLKEYFEQLSGGRYGSTRPAPKGVAVELSGIPDTHKTPMTSVAMHMNAQITYSSTVTGATKPLFGPGQTITLHLALQKYGLTDANYRFAWTGSDTNGVIYIEALGAGPKAENTPTVDAAANTITVGSLTFTTEGSWTPERLGRLRQALSLFPVEALKPVDKLKFKIDSGAAPGGEEGSYDDEHHVVTLYASLFSITDVRFGESPKPVQEIVHEIAHAIDRAPLRAAWQKYQTSGKESDLTGVVSPSGGKWVKDAGGVWQIAERMQAADGAFRTAAAQDGVVKTTTKITDAAGVEQTLTHLKGGVSDYSNTNWTELYAESLALYTTDPATLKLIRPNIYAYFAAKFPRQTK